jgi:hypothetical protein
MDFYMTTNILFASGWGAIGFFFLWGPVLLAVAQLLIVWFILRSDKLLILNFFFSLAAFVSGCQIFLSMLLSASSPGAPPLLVWALPMVSGALCLAIWWMRSPEENYPKLMAILRGIFWGSILCLLVLMVQVNVPMHPLESLLLSLPTLVSGVCLFVLRQAAKEGPRPINELTLTSLSNRAEEISAFFRNSLEQNPGGEDEIEAGLVFSQYLNRALSRPDCPKELAQRANRAMEYLSKYKGVPYSALKELASDVIRWSELEERT